MQKHVTRPELQLVERISEMPLTETHDHIFVVPEIEDRLRAASQRGRVSVKAYKG